MRRLLTSLALAVTLSGCATLQQFTALRSVDFSIDRVSNVRLAGVDLTSVDSYRDLGLADIGRLTLAVSQGNLPMDFRLHLSAENPADNTADARLLRMDWTLLLQDRETVSGVFADETLLRRGQPTDVPISMSLDLIDFFEGSAQDLVELALSLSGQGGSPREVTLRATPSVDTAFGPISYPRPITIVSREFGQ
ncbi:MAG: hypothetical protein OEO79_07720 [Gemmatimonadota bacterium]|nr:hypothetical protein [Gemmatimonadota bacterium]